MQKVLLLLLKGLGVVFQVLAVIAGGLFKFVSDLADTAAKQIFGPSSRRKDET